MQDITGTRRGVNLAMAKNLVARSTIVAAGAFGIPAAGHASSDDLFKAGFQGRRRLLIVRRMEITHAGKPKAIGIAAIMSPLDKDVEISGVKTSGENVSELVHQEMIPDIAPTVGIHVDVLHSPDIRRGG